MRHTPVLVLLALLTAVSPSFTAAQVRLDGTLFAMRFEDKDVFGPGVGLHVSFFDYAAELTASAGYFITPDTTESWSVRFDARANLPTLRIARPYLGFGFERTSDRGVQRTTPAAIGGLYFSFPFGDRMLPFVEASYRTAGALEDWRYRAGLRIQFRSP